MDISQLKNQNQIIFLTTNNSTPIKKKRFSYSNSQMANKFKSKLKNQNKIKDSTININSSSVSKKYIFNSYKIPPLIALLIYERTINKLFEFIKQRISKNNFLEIKKKYIAFVSEELHIKSKNILKNITEQDLLNLNVKLFISNFNNYLAQYNNKLNLNTNALYKTNYNSNSLFQLKKNKLKSEKLLSFNNDEFKKNKAIINSSKSKKPKNVCQTEYIHKYSNNSGNKLTKLIKNRKIEINTEYFNHFRNISITNGSPAKAPGKSALFENRKKINNLKERIINKQKKISLIKDKKEKISKKINAQENKPFGSEEKKVNLNDIKDNEKNSIHQLNLIKENLEDNLKNMFNFSYGYFLNCERESDSSKSLYKFNNENSNIKKN